MKWITKSTTILGLVITAATAIAQFLGDISPDIVKLGETLGPVIVAFGFRKKLQENGAAPKE